MSKETAANAILAHFTQFCKLPEAPEHAEKTENELMDMGFDGKITKEEFHVIMEWKKNQVDNPVDVHAKLINELIEELVPSKKRGTGELAPKDIQNKFVTESLGLPWRKVDAAKAIAKIIGSFDYNGITFRSEFKTNEAFFEQLKKLAKGEEKLKALVKKEMDFFQAQSKELAAKKTEAKK